jgi:cytochrome c oxidase subunit III
MHPEAAAESHFASPEVQRQAARFGMWTFLATEILLFAGLFVAYVEYRSLYHESFVQGGRHLDAVLATIETAVLISGSFTVAMAHHYTLHGRSGRACAGLLIAAASGIAFLALHGVEYVTHFREGALPGKYYTFSEIQVAGASMFFTLYFLLTGLHSLHVLAGTGVLLWLGFLAARGAFSPEHYSAVENGGLYWHLVDLIWIFLYPLLYLIG